MNIKATSILPKKCWIFSNKRYILKGSSLSELPYVNLEYEPILKANGIPYRKSIKTIDRLYNISTVEVCEYWNPEVDLKEVEICLPLFATVGNSYHYCNKNYSEKVPTSEVIEAAKKITRFVEKQIEDYEEILREVELYQFVKQKLSGSITKMFHEYELGVPHNYIQDIDMNHDKFKILSVSFSHWIAIFDMNKIAKNGYITLQVPKQIVGAVIGKDGSNIKYWAKEIGVKKIQVIPI